MKRLLFIAFLLTSLLVHGQTTNFSFTSLPFSSTDLKNPNRGFSTWGSGNAAWANNANGVKLPTSSDVRGYNNYRRINWAQIENAGSGTTPANPRWDWTIFDATVNSCIDNGQMFDLGILPIAPGYDPYGAAGAQNLSYPTWLHNAMQAEPTKDILYDSDWIPDWNSNTYLAALDSLNNAVASRIATKSYTPSSGPWVGQSIAYSKVVFFVDIRGYGQSGEWNMSGYSATNINACGGPCTFAIDAEMALGRHPTVASFKRMIQSHINAFPNYPLVAISDGFDTNAGNSSIIPDSTVYHLLNYSNTWGRFGWRRDNWANDQSGKLESNPLVMGGWHADTAITNRYKFAPIVGEPYAGSYSIQGAGPYYNMPAAVRQYHVNSIGNGNYYTYTAQMGDSIIEASKWMGYRLEPTAGSMTTTLTQNSTFNITLTWKNGGVAPVYIATNCIYELKTSGDAVVASWTSSFNPRLFMSTSQQFNENFNLGNVTPGTTYKLTVKLVDPKGYAIPIKLALTSPAQNADGSYTLRSNITVQAQQALPTPRNRVIIYGSPEPFELNYVPGEAIIKSPTPRSVSIGVYDITGRELERGSTWAGAGDTKYHLKKN